MILYCKKLKYILSLQSDLVKIGDCLKCGNSSVGRAQPCQGWGRGFESRFPLNILDKLIDNYSILAQVAELVDAHVSGACAERCAGSSPVLGTIIQNALYVGEVAELVDALL